MEIFLSKVKKRICIILRFQGLHAVEEHMRYSQLYQAVEFRYKRVWMPQGIHCEEGKNRLLRCYPSVNGGCFPGSSPVGHAVSIVDFCLMVLTSSSGSNPKSELLACGSLVFMGFVFAFDFMFLVC